MQIVQIRSYYIGKEMRSFVMYVRRNLMIDDHSLQTRGKKILEQLSRPRFFPGFEISRSFLRAKQVGKKGGKFQKPEIIVFLKVVLISFCL